MLVVGAGAVAARRVRVLRRFGARVRVVAPENRAGLENVILRGFLPSDLDGAVLAVAAVRFLFRRQDADWLPLLGMYAASGAILGHNFPVQLGFKGGKGIACTAGLVLTLGPIVTALEAATFLLTIFLTRYVSLGSILVVIELVVVLVVLGQNGYYGMSQGHLMEFYALSVLLACMAIYRHRANIVRLLHGTESRIFQKKSE